MRVVPLLLFSYYTYTLLYYLILPNMLGFQYFTLRMHFEFLTDESIIQAFAIPTKNNYKDCTFWAIIICLKSSLWSE